MPAPPVRRPVSRADEESSDEEEEEPKGLFGGLFGSRCVPYLFRYIDLVARRGGRKMHTRGCSEAVWIEVPVSSSTPNPDLTAYLLRASADHSSPLD